MSDIVKFVEVVTKPGVHFEAGFKCPACGLRADVKQDMFGNITTASQCHCSMSARNSFDNAKIIVMAVKEGYAKGGL